MLVRFARGPNQLRRILHGVLCFALLLASWCILTQSRSTLNDFTLGEVRGENFDTFSSRSLAQIIALDSGVLHGPANTILSAKRAIAAGATALNVDAVLSGGRLIAAHNATHRLPFGLKFACGNLSVCSQDELDRELSPTCQYFKHYFLELGVPSVALGSLKFCEPQRLNFIEDFLEQFPEVPMILDLKSETVTGTRRAVKILHDMLETSFPDRPSNHTALRVFLPPRELMEVFDTDFWHWPRLKLAIGIPKVDSNLQTDAWEVLPHLSQETLKHVTTIFATPLQLQAATKQQRRLQQLEQTGGLSFVCDLGCHEAESDFQSFDEKVGLCTRHGASMIHTGRIAALANVLNLGEFNRANETKADQNMPYLANESASLMIISQKGAEKTMRFWSSTGAFEMGSVWTRCAGKVAASLLVMRLVELKLLPSLDEPIISFLNLTGTWFPDWKLHPVMKQLTLRHIMAGVAGLPKWTWRTDWLRDNLTSALEVAERSLSYVNSSFVPGEFFAYSNVQWAVVEVAVERATGLEWPAAAQKFLFEPLGLSKNTYYRSEDKPACYQMPHDSIYERNLRAAIGLCSTADDMFLLGITLRNSCKQCFLSEAGMREVMLDQLAENFPKAVHSLLNTSPVVDFARHGLQFVGKAFAGYIMKGGWLLAHGGPDRYLGQNVLVQNQHGTADKDSGVMVTLISKFAMPVAAKTQVEEALKKFMAEATNVSRVQGKLQDCSEPAVIHRLPAFDCHWPLPNGTDTKMIAEMAEVKHACRGFALERTDRTVPAAKQPKQCGSDAFWQMDPDPSPCAKPSQITSAEKTQLRKLVNSCLNSTANSTCQMSACTSAWHGVGKQGADLSHELRRVVRKQHELLQRIAKEPNIVGLPTCFRFPVQLDHLCGGMKSYHSQVPSMEPLFPDLRNMWFHEHEALIDFTPYVPLPAIDAERVAEMNPGKKILIVAGANKFCRAPRYLMDMYSPYLAFDQVILIDGHDIDGVPDNSSQISVRQSFLKVGTRNNLDLIATLPTLVKEEDFVVIMWDTDLVAQPATLEWGFMADLLSQKHSLVDELFVKMHFQYPEIGWGHHDRHTAREALELLWQLRHTCGFAVHPWP